MKFAYSKEINLNINNTIEKIKKVLPKYGFGIIYEIDFQQTFKNKIAQDIDDYIILGICNPNYAFQAYNQITEIGLLLPCNLSLDLKAINNLSNEIEQQLEKIIEEI